MVAPDFVAVVVVVVVVKVVVVVVVVDVVVVEVVVVDVVVVVVAGLQMISMVSSVYTDQSQVTLPPWGHFLAVEAFM